MDSGRNDLQPNFSNSITHSFLRISGKILSREKKLHLFLACFRLTLGIVGTQVNTWSDYGKKMLTDEKVFITRTFTEFHQLTTNCFPPLACLKERVIHDSTSFNIFQLVE